MYNRLKALIDSISNECDIMAELTVNLTEDSKLGSSINDIKTFRAICFGEQNIGEAVIQIDRLTQGQLFNIYPEIDWKSIRGMKNHLVHEYLDIDENLIISTAVLDIPVLKETVTQIQKDIDNGRLNKLLTYIEMAKRNKDFVIPRFSPIQKKF